MRNTVGRKKDQLKKYRSLSNQALFNILCNSGVNINHKTAFEVLTERSHNKKVENELDARLTGAKKTEKFRLLKLGININRKKYLKQYIKAIQANNKIDYSSAGFFEEIINKPLTHEELEIVENTLLSSKNISPSLIRFLDSHRILDVRNVLTQWMIENGANHSFIRSYLTNKERGLLQETIRNTIVTHIDTEPDICILLGENLDFAIEENQRLVVSLFSYSELFVMLKHNTWKYDKQNSFVYPIELVYRIFKQKTLTEEQKNTVMSYIEQVAQGYLDVEKCDAFLDFVASLVYIDRTYVEQILKQLYKKTQLYSDKVLVTLATIHSQFAYRELLSIMLTSEDNDRRFKSTRDLIICFPEKAGLVYSYAEELDDKQLLHMIKRAVSKNTNETSQNYEMDLDCTSSIKCKVIGHDEVLNEYLCEIAEKINANIFYAATGFLYTSGLRLLTPIINCVQNNAGVINFIVGSLQHYERGNKKINRDSILSLQKLLQNSKVKLYTYQKAFYHGKFYYVANDSVAYIIIGSSNISRTAYINNYELNTVFKVERYSQEERKFLDWYNGFRSECVQITSLDETKFDNVSWNSELDVFVPAKVIENEVARKKIKKLDEQESQRRLLAWISHEPTYIYEEVKISALKDYMVFIFSGKQIAVFESTIHGNASYIFDCYDVNKLFDELAELSKTEMQRNSEEYKRRIYHVNDNDDWEKIVDKVFSEK